MSKLSNSLQPTIVISILQNLVFAVIASALGILYGMQAGLHAPVFESISNGLPPWDAIQSQIIPAVVIGTISGFIFVGLYFGVFRPWINTEDAILAEKVRLEMGLPTRVLMGGVYEEIVFRWGVLGFLAWIGLKLVGSTSPFIMWSANILAGLTFGFAHLPGMSTLGITPTRALMVSSLVLNLMAGIVFGWLFWQNGLLAAMTAHALYHVILFLFERYAINR